MIKVSRREWGARPPKSTPLGINTRSATGHWEGTHMGSFPHASCATKMRVIQNYHMDTQGWNDIAYNFAVCPHGYVYVGRDHGIRSSANGSNSGNSESEAVCFLGGLGDPFPYEAKVAYRDILNEISNIKYCHNHWFNTMCPGPEICDFIKAGCPIPDLPMPPKQEDDDLHTPEVAVASNGTPYYFVRGTGPNCLYANKGGEPNTWYDVFTDFELTSSPSAATQGDTIIVTARGKDNAVWVCSLDTKTNQWNPWWSTGGQA